MQIGKKIHIKSNKKTYRKPVMDVVIIDREIALMANSGTGFPFAPSNQGSTTTTKDNSTYKKALPPSKSSDSPFGGGTPDFQR